MQNVLVITPSVTENPISLIFSALKTAGFRVARMALDSSHANTMEILCQVFEGRPPDVLIVDLSKSADSLPAVHIQRLLRHMWSEDLPLPPCLTLLSSHHLAAPEWPAYTDDFLLPPYAPAEARARITRLLFQQRHISSGGRLPFADLVLELSGGYATDGQGNRLVLTPREYDLLCFLVTHRGKVFGRDRLLDMVWGIDFEGGERTVDIHIRRLRAKMPPQSAHLLETRRGLGYGFRVLD